MLATRRLGLLLVAVAMVLPASVQAASILSMDAAIAIRPDASIQVVETITTDPLGPHGIYRDIPLSFTTADGRAQFISISDVSARDESGAPYQVLTSLEGSNTHIRIGDPDVTVSGVKTYVISYTVRGALTPYDTFDELYWNATGDEWSVLIASSSATVTLPARVDVSHVRAACYIGIRGSHNTCPPTVNGNDGGVTTVVFAGPALNPGQGLTIAVGFPKDLVVYPPPVPWWREWLLSLIAGALLVGAIIFATIFALRDRKGRGTIIPIYEPPSALRPAEADVLVHGRVSKRSWSSTMIDLAVRGYVKIAEDTPLPLWRSGGFWGLLFGAACLIALFYASVVAPGLVTTWVGIKLLVVIVAIAAFVLILPRRTSWSLRRKDYVVTEVAGTDPSRLEGYEVKFVSAIFLSHSFSTRAMRKDTGRAQVLYVAMMAVETDLRKETASDSAAYVLDPETARKWRIIAIFGYIIAFLGLFFLAAFGPDGMLATAVTLVASTVMLYPVYLRPRLNRAGSIEREAWLGFKLYLETAEKYRLQNLTPDLFQKFLPYAMVFGIEKKWAKAFEGIAMLPPSWYSGSAAAGAFSASSFTNSFSSSFSSSFAASGASGASGGGGGAGGGGGGGGGGGW